ncbi:MAG: GntP family permease [Planctomycetales bacterium]|nr:GntP family permease [Planctomycetales bacterium]
MHPVVLLLIGVAIVLGGVLLFRLHAFLALILAALTVASLTPLANREQYLGSKVALEPHKGYVVDGEAVRLAKNLPAGTPMVFLRREDDGWVESGTAAVTMVELDSGDMQSVLAGGAAFADPAGMLMTSAQWQQVRSDAGKGVGDRVGSAFGSTCGKIGILIALAAIIGKCLLDSGAADRIVRAALHLVGERGAPAAFVVSGFTLGIPVFFDTVFYLLIPLGKALRLRTGKNYLLYILTIVCGGTMAHSLVPPTPGPLLVAGELHVDIGLMILGGILVGLCTSSAGFLYANLMNRMLDVPLRETPESMKELQEITGRDTSELPPLWLSLLPILLPVVLIAGYTVLDTLAKRTDAGASEWLTPTVMSWSAALGNKNIALAIAAVISILTLVVVRRVSREQLAESMQQALQSGGVIILITAAGGAFGAALQQTGIVEIIRRLPEGSPAVILTLAFLITAAVRTAQGSSTVAMITAVGVLSGFADPQTLGCHPLYLALAIGCGSKPVAWMNDSGFWVICKMSGMTEAEGLRFITPLSILMGVTGLAVTLLAATFLPLT